MGAGAQQVTALVVVAQGPLDNRHMKADRFQGRVQILARTKPEPLLVEGRFIMGRDRWLVRGMEIPVTIDTADPGHFEIGWDQIPSMEQRAAAGDATLADPAGTRKRLVDALTAAMGPALGTPTPDQRLADVSSLVAEVRDQEAPANFKESLDRAAHARAPDGKTGAIVQIVSVAATLRSAEGSGDADVYSTSYYRDSDGKHDAVLSVTIPGSEPYAVYKQKFNHKSRQGDEGAAWGCRPRLVDRPDRRRGALGRAPLRQGARPADCRSGDGAGAAEDRGLHTGDGRRGRGKARDPPAGLSPG